MTKNSLSKQPRTQFVTHLPDLMRPEDYMHSPEKKKIRIRITYTEQGIEILGDSRYVQLLEDLFINIGAEEIEMMLCG